MEEGGEGKSWSGGLPPEIVIQKDEAARQGFPSAHAAWSWEEEEVVVEGVAWVRYKMEPVRCSVVYVPKFAVSGRCGEMDVRVRLGWQGDGIWDVMVEAISIHD
jgi:hypothetical protein